MRYPVLIPLGCVLITSAVLAVFAADPVGTRPPVGVSPMPTAPRVAVANPFRIFSEIKETQQLFARLKDSENQVKAAGQQKADAINKLIDARSSYNPENDNFRKATDQIDMATADAQAWNAFQRKSLERQQKWEVKAIFEKIDLAVAQVAQQNNIDIVISDDRQQIKNIDDVPSEALMRQMVSSRSVLYSNKGVDISEQVILLLESKFAAKR